jgi:C4-type Zn-finger protein
MLDDGSLQASDYNSDASIQSQNDPAKIQVIIVEQEWLNIEVLRSNLQSINRTNECCFVKEGKGALETVTSVVELALASFKPKPDLVQQ